MGKLRASLLAGGAGIIALAGTSVLTVPASAGVIGGYQFGQNGQFPLGTMTMAKRNMYSDTFASGTTDTGVWRIDDKVVRIKITGSSQPLDIGCVLKGKVTTAGIGSASAPGSYKCKSGSTGTWYAVKTSGTVPSSSGRTSWFQG